MRPIRDAMKQIDGSWCVTVTPPLETGFSPSHVVLTPDQYQRYQQWLEGKQLIQEALPELAGWQREILITGIGPDQWKDAFGEDE